MADVRALKRQALEKFFAALNDPQQRAVFSVNGPVLVLAGAGSGKTTAIIHRIVNMVYFGNGYDGADDNILQEDALWLKNYADGKEALDIDRLRAIVAVRPVCPTNILAITFTNKAAGELRARLEKIFGTETAMKIHASTFHSACVSFLRRSIPLLGFERDFAIYDTDDARRLMKSVLAEANISEKNFPPRSVLQEISIAKDGMISPDEMARQAGKNYRGTVIAKLYSLYQEHLRRSNALDFDDIIYYTVELFRRFPEELEKYQNRYRYLLVDEYQDTNHAQYQLISLLTKKSHNVCVVGDDDQSIYRFRGATIENILGFEEEFPGCAVIRLEQNYRSTQTILDAANSVISHNIGRKKKRLWTSAGAGSPILWYRASDELDEADYVANSIARGVEQGGSFADNAVLYRMNAQGNALERELVRSGIPYRIYGGTRFYERKEIRDIIAYMSIVANPYDMVRFERVLNEPKRGLGQATLSLVEDITRDLALSPLEVVRHAGEYPILSRKVPSLQKFASMWDSLIAAAETLPLVDFLDALLDVTGYRDMLQKIGEEGALRLENIEELKSSIVRYAKETETPSIEGFLEEVSLYTDADIYEEQGDNVALMTMHAAKGLEFENVYLVGMEQGVFPGALSMDSPEEMEEERRLAYVALTRAKKRLTIITADKRTLFGVTKRNAPSDFLKEIDPSLIEQKDSRCLRQRPMDPAGFFGRQFTPLQMQTAKKPHVSTTPPDFAVGERIRHNTFGEGTILSVVKVASDSMLEVGFDKVGKKKIMANYAKIEKISGQA